MRFKLQLSCALGRVKVAIKVAIKVAVKVAVEVAIIRLRLRL